MPSVLLPKTIVHDTLSDSFDSAISEARKYAANHWHNGKLLQRKGALQAIEHAVAAIGTDQFTLGTVNTLLLEAYQVERDWPLAQLITFVGDAHTICTEYCAGLTDAHTLQGALNRLAKRMEFLSELPSAPKVVPAKNGDADVQRISKRILTFVQHDLEDKNIRGQWNMRIDRSGNFTLHIDHADGVLNYKNPSKNEFLFITETDMWIREEEEYEHRLEAAHTLLTKANAIETTAREQADILRASAAFITRKRL